MSGLDSLVVLAWQGKPGSLVDALNKLQAKITALEHRPMVLGDLSESAQKFFAVIGAFKERLQVRKIFSVVNVVSGKRVGHCRTGLAPSLNIPSGLDQFGRGKHEFQCVGKEHDGVKIIAVVEFAFAAMDIMVAAVSAKPSGR